MTRGKFLSEELRKAVFSHHTSGSSQSEISRILKIPRTTVGSILKKGQPMMDRRAVTNGAARATTEREDRLIKREAILNPFITSFELRETLRELNPNPCSARTIRSRLCDYGLRSRRTAKKPLLSEKNVKDRLTFARTYKATITISKRLKNQVLATCRLIDDTNIGPEANHQEEEAIHIVEDVLERLSAIVSPDSSTGGSGTDSD
ncbi:unnamed protein product [Auanema sp. JU1783]|nr:unnamed protein product [Auanema sp. JU1783]